MKASRPTERTEAGTVTDSTVELAKARSPMEVTVSGSVTSVAEPLYFTRTPASSISKSSASAARTVTGMDALLVAPASVVTVAVSLPEPA